MLVLERSDTAITLRFAGIIDAIEIGVLCNEISVAVNHNGLNWDTLQWFECEPKVVSGGVVCDLCDPAEQLVYATHCALLHDHLFEPLEEWIEAKLFPAYAIGLGQSDGGSTWAGLLCPGDNHRGYSVFLPLRR